MKIIVLFNCVIFIIIDALYQFHFIIIIFYYIFYQLIINTKATYVYIYIYIYTYVYIYIYSECNVKHVPQNNTIDLYIGIFKTRKRKKVTLKCQVKFPRKNYRRNKCML